jgi:hypothetical protein
MLFNQKKLKKKTGLGRRKTEKDIKFIARKKQKKKPGLGKRKTG